MLITVTFFIGINALTSIIERNTRFATKLITSNDNIHFNT